MKVRTYETHAVICEDSGVEVRVASGRKSPFRFRREIISQRGNATGLSVTTIMVNNAVRGYSRNVNDYVGFCEKIVSQFAIPFPSNNDPRSHLTIWRCIDT